MAKWRDGEIEERRKITPNPKRWNDGTAERRNGGKSPESLKDGMTESRPKSFTDGTAESQKDGTINPGREELGK